MDPWGVERIRKRKSVDDTACDLIAEYMAKPSEQNYHRARQYLDWNKDRMRSAEAYDQALENVRDSINSLKQQED